MFGGFDDQGDNWLNGLSAGEGFSSLEDIAELFPNMDQPSSVVSLIAHRSSSGSLGNMLTSTTSRSPSLGSIGYRSDPSLENMKCDPHSHEASSTPGAAWVNQGGIFGTPKSDLSSGESYHSDDRVRKYFSTENPFELAKRVPIFNGQHEFHIERIIHGTEESRRYIEQVRYKQKAAIAAGDTNELVNLAQAVDEKYRQATVFVEKIHEQLGVELLSLYHVLHIRWLQRQLKTILIMYCVVAEELDILLRKGGIQVNRLRPLPANISVPQVYKMNEGVLHRVTEVEHIPARLIISDQPEANIVFKGKSFSKEFQVIMLSGVTANLALVGKVKCNLDSVTSQPPRSKGTKRPLVDDSEVLDSNLLCASLSPKMLIGTRKSTSEFVFSIPIEHDGGSYLLTSSATLPFIVITNESQWSEAAGILMAKLVFGGDEVAKWLTCANMLQIQFLNATRQKINNSPRPLTRPELDYIHAKWFRRQSEISIRDFRTFWQWFGKCLHVLRYGKYIAPLFASGFIYGFMSRDDVESVLQQRPGGTFLLRFSEHHAGLFAVSYSFQKQVRHFLARYNDAGDRKKSLPAFLMECPQFVYMLQAQWNAKTGQRSFASHLKDHICESYLSGEPSNTTPGYDDTLPPPELL